MSWSDTPGRRRLLQAAAGSAAAAALAGCGFRLRQTPSLPFDRIALRGFVPRSPLAEALTLALAPSVRLTTDLASAQVVLESLAEARERSVVGQTSSAQVRFIQLRLRFQFRARTPAGRELIPAMTLLLARDMSYNETAALAKELEEADLFREMQADITTQVMQRLATVRL